jgi:hypothetical protein
LNLIIVPETDGQLFTLFFVMRNEISGVRRCLLISAIHSLKDFLDYKEIMRSVMNYTAFQQTYQYRARINMVEPKEHRKPTRCGNPESVLLVDWI